MSDDWDIDSYKTEHENEEHWELRRKFMLTHKDKFPEDELVCLAQVFTNIEFMGCRYPDQTMIRVAELAKGVVENYREKRKGSLKRTFVAASDAASSKVKGQTQQRRSGPMKIKKINFIKSGTPSVVDEIIQSDDNERDVKNSSVEVRASKKGGKKAFNSHGEQSIKNKNGLPREFVLVMDGSSNPSNTLHKSAALNKCVLRWEVDAESIGGKTSRVYLNNSFLAKGFGETKKISKRNAAIAAMDKLRESYPAIMINTKHYSQTTVDSIQLESFEKTSTDILSEDNIGRKMLKLMGWQGGGLGSQGQGVEEPVVSAVKVDRRGFGHLAGSSTISEFKTKAKAYIRNWMYSNSLHDLVFSSEFNHEERKAMHQIASSWSLKSRSYGKGKNRYLVITKKWDPQEMVEELKRAGGVFGKYELLYPTKSS